MITINLPKTIRNGDDVVILARRDYERLVRGQDVPSKRQATALDRDLGEAIAEYQVGKAIGPFDNVRDLMRSLRSR